MGEVSSLWENLFPVTSPIGKFMIQCPPPWENLCSSLVTNRKFIIQYPPLWENLCSSLLPRVKPMIVPSPIGECMILSPPIWENLCSSLTNYGRIYYIVSSPVKNLCFDLLPTGHTYDPIFFPSGEPMVQSSQLCENLCSSLLPMGEFMIQYLP